MLGRFVLFSCLLTLRLVRKNFRGRLPSPLPQADAVTHAWVYGVGLSYLALEVEVAESIPVHALTTTTAVLAVYKRDELTMPLEKMMRDQLFPGFPGFLWASKKFYTF